MERLLQVIWKIPVASVLCSDREFTAEIRDQYHLKIKKGAEQADSCLACFRQFQKRVRQDNKIDLKLFKNYCDANEREILTLIHLFVCLVNWQWYWNLSKQTLTTETMCNFIIINVSRKCSMKSHWVASCHWTVVRFVLTPLRPYYILWGLYDHILSKMGDGSHNREWRPLSLVKLIFYDACRQNWQNPFKLHETKNDWSPK